MISGVFFLACGMYIGKYYPEYVPIPKINQMYVNSVFEYIKSFQSKPPTSEKIN